MIKTTGSMDENETRQRKQNDQAGQKWDTKIDLEMPIYGGKSVTENLNKDVHICRSQVILNRQWKIAVIWGRKKALNIRKHETPKT